MNKFNYNKTLTFYGYSNVKVVKLLGSFYFCNKLFLLFLEEKDNLLFNSLFVIKDGKIVDYICNFIDQQFNFESSSIMDGSFFSKNLKPYLFYTGSVMDENGNFKSVIVRSDFSPINNLISHKTELRVDFNNVKKYNQNISNPFVFSYNNRYYLLVVSNNLETNNATLLLFSLSDFLNNPRFIKEINIKDIYETIDSIHLKVMGNSILLFVTSTFKNKSTKDPLNGQISFYSIIEDLHNFFNDKDEIYFITNFNKVDVSDNFIYPLIYSINNANYLLGVVSDSVNNNLITSPKVFSFDGNKIKLTLNEVSKKLISKIFDNRVLFRELYLEDDHKIELLDDQKLLFTISYDGFDLKIENHTTSKVDESYILVNKDKCNVKVLVDTNVLEIYIDNSCVYTSIIHIEKKILMHKNFIVKI